MNQVDESLVDIRNHLRLMHPDQKSPPHLGAGSVIIHDDDEKWTVWEL